MHMGKVKHTLPVRSTRLNPLRSRMVNMNTTIQDRIRETRKAWKLTQTEFGKLAGVSKAAVSQWENGITTPERDSLLNLQKKRRLSPTWVLTGHGDQYVDAGKMPDSGQDNVVQLPTNGLTPPLDELISIAKTMSLQGQWELLGQARMLAAKHPAAKANPAK